MKVTLLALIIIVFSTFAASGSELVSCQQLVNEAGAWDGKMVSISGEVVGDILHVSGHVWLNVNDGTNAIGVWGDSGLVEEFRIVPGRYETIGTRLNIEGEFHRTCSLHSGETDIHLTKAALLKDAEEVAHPVNRGRLIIASSLFALSMLLALPGRLRRRIRPR